MLATQAATGAAAPPADGERQARQAAWQRLAGEAAQSRTWGDCYGYLLVATGRAEVAVYPLVLAELQDGRGRNSVWPVL